jgi:Na+-transporting methylmalonyl-CoA/oxaloacetate decarboxylase gamma subunit
MDLAFGLSVTLAGMGVTLATLYVLTLVVHLMNRLLPYKEEPEKKK